MVQAGWGKKQDPSSKRIRAKRAGGMAPNKHKALSSNPNTARKQRNTHKGKHTREMLNAAHET
jgi:hypothetical protein